MKCIFIFLDREKGILKPNDRLRGTLQKLKHLKDIAKKKNGS